jgi:tRNA pseudouridine38-40 synthase
MTRYKLTLEYDGTPFVGWQRQKNGVSVQETLENAVLSLTGESVTAQGAGRTDAGVHALGQVVHLDIGKEFGPDKLMAALNFHLRPAPVSVLAAEIATGEFHARFSATARAYLYRIINRRAPLAVERDRAWLVNARLDPGIMGQAAQILVGRHDFSTFRASLCQAQSPVKTLDRLDVEGNGEEIRFHVEARSFLHHQVRNMVGSLCLVGEGKWSPADLREALEARDRARGGPTAPACGLYLTRVSYDAREA